MADFWQSWQGLTGPQRLAAISLMEADNSPYRMRDARNVIHATYNRAQNLGWDTDRVINFKAPGARYGWYQPLWEPTQQARLQRIVSSPEFADHTSYAEGVLNGQHPDVTNGATHFVAKNIEQLAAREPMKYRTFRQWATPENSREVDDYSHRFYRVTDGRHARPQDAQPTLSTPLNQIDWSQNPYATQTAPQPETAPSAPYNTAEKPSETKMRILDVPMQTPARPTVPPTASAPGVPPGMYPTTPYSAMLAKNLIEAKVSQAPGWFEGISTALANGVGAYASLKDDADRLGRDRQLYGTIANEPGVDPLVKAYAAHNPGEGLKLFMADKKEKAAALAAERKSELDFARQRWLKEIEHGLKERDWSNFEMKPDPNTGVLTAWHKGTGLKAEDYLKRLQDGQNPTILTPQTQAVQNTPLPPAPPARSIVPPQPAPYTPTTPDAPKPTVTSPTPGLQIETRAPQSPAPTATPADATPTAPTAPQQPATKPYVPSNTTLSADGKFALHSSGQRFNMYDNSGNRIPDAVFRNAVDLTANPKQRDEAAKAAYDRHTKLLEGLDKGIEDAQNVKGLIDQFNYANRLSASGKPEESLNVARNLGLTMGITDAHKLDSAQLMGAINQQLTRSVKLAGSVSNYEQELYKSSVPGLANTRIGNYLMGKMMSAIAQRQIEKQQFASQYLEWKQQAGLTPVIDGGFDRLWREHVEAHPVLDEQTKALMLAATKNRKQAEKMLDGMLDTDPATRLPGTQQTPTAPNAPATPQVAAPKAQQQTEAPAEDPLKWERTMFDPPDAKPQQKTQAPALPAGLKPPSEYGYKPGKRVQGADGRIYTVSPSGEWVTQ